MAGAQTVLEATASRIRHEVNWFDGDLLDEKLLLLQQVEHLDASLSLLERLLPAGADTDVKVLSPEELCEACGHMRMAIHTMLALAPKFRESTHHNLVRQFGSGSCSIFDFCSKRRAAVELPPQKRRSRLRVQLDKLEKQHEACLLDLLLSFEHLITLAVIPPPDAPSRCAEGSRYVLAGQAKLHESHAMLRQLLVEEDDVLLPILEWQLGAATSDLAVARAVLNRLPRPSTSWTRNKIKNHSPAPATVGIRCESKASIVHCHSPGEPSIRFDDHNLRTSPTEPSPHEIRTPVLAANRCFEKDYCMADSSQNPSSSATPFNKPCDSMLQTDGFCDCNNGISSMRNCTSLPDLGALGPCSACCSKDGDRQHQDQAAKRYRWNALECQTGRGVSLSPYEPTAACYTSWNSRVGNACCQR
ncbi:hypothetical protein cyc_03445 [Cyclospora cayetanensis]|nr:hypothetical protein cyc_03445 [Cyclospora cayetanensis]